MKDRIANGRLDPELQVALMRKARKDRADDPMHGRKIISELYLHFPVQVFSIAIPDGGMLSVREISLISNHSFDLLKYNI